MADEFEGIEPAVPGDAFERLTEVSIDGLEMPEMFDPEDLARAVSAFHAAAEWLRNGRPGAVSMTVLTKGEPNPLLTIVRIGADAQAKAMRIVVCQDETGDDAFAGVVHLRAQIDHHEGV